MSLWTLTPAELVAELSRPAPARQACVAVAGPTQQQIKAARAVLKAARPRRMTFRGWADFQPAYSFACWAASGAGADPQWYLRPDTCLKARVPAAWVSCPLERRASVSPRDINFPAARFWHGGRLPVGPDYAPLMVGRAAQNVTVWRPREPAPAFNLEPCEWVEMGEAAD